jgi:hypothetical protein
MRACICWAARTGHSSGAVQSHAQARFLLTQRMLTLPGVLQPRLDSGAEDSLAVQYPTTKATMRGNRMLGRHLAAAHDRPTTRCQEEPTTRTSVSRSWFSGPRAACRLTNWGETVDRQMHGIYTPTSVEEVQSHVRAAAEQGRRVRATGYQHTWADFFPDTDQILLAMLPNTHVRHAILRALPFVLT